MVRKMMKRTLLDAGYEVRETCNGKKGLEFLEEASSDLVITDIIMPVMDGIETIIELRKKFPHTKILAISGGGTRMILNVLGIARRLGAQSTLEKPFKPETLLARVRTMLSWPMPQAARDTHQYHAQSDYGGENVISISGKLLTLLDRSKLERFAGDKARATAPTFYLSCEASIRPVVA